ncbi:MAG: hypothetical protein ACE15C_09365 [Phycisphaerae bacterium]
MGKYRLYIVAAAVVGVLGGLAGALVWHLERPYRFGVVQEGVLYRSGQPRGHEWDTLRDTYGIKTVIDLRELKPSRGWSIEQDRFCREHEIRLVHIPFPNMDAPTPRQWQAFLEIVRDPANWPVLVHCEVGTARTGMMVGAYRIVVQGWDFDSALREARENNFNDEKHYRYVQFWKELALAGTASPAVH